jgi:hypothetical protein
MRFASYVYQGSINKGVLGPGDRLHPLPDGETAEALIVRAGRAALLGAGAAALDADPGPAVAEVRLLPPPGQMK